jgi:phospho-2-dehydro-3-deoxyheptonate aldolase
VRVRWQGRAAKLEYGKSITDACIGRETSMEVLRELAAAAKARHRHLR